MKQKILNWLYKNNSDFFIKKVVENDSRDDLNLEKVFNDNRRYFELLLIKDFVGYIPKEINEPTLKIFEDHGEMFERWILWQSYFINRKSINDPSKITFYHGMMVYLKVLHTMAKINKKTPVARVKISQPEPEKPWIEKALDDIEAFKKGIKEPAKPVEETKSE